MSFTDSAARPNAWRNVLLVLSLCFNVALLAILGVGVARMATAARVPFIGQPAGPLAPGQVLRSLSPERRQALQAALMRRRLLARPASVLLSATGCFLPLPSV
jgi:hypothetical protein